MTMTKHYIEIQREPTTGYQPYVGWDALYDSLADARTAMVRAKAAYHDARIATIEAPAHVDHLYRRVQIDDTTSLYQ